MCPGGQCPALQAGVVALGEVDAGALAMFSFVAPDASLDIKVRLTQVGGASISAYLSTGAGVPVMSAAAPYTVSGAQYTGEWDQGAIVVPASAHLGQRVAIGVAQSDATGASASCRFTVVATNCAAGSQGVFQDVISLQEGVPQYAIAPALSYTNFRAEIYRAATMDGTTPAQDLTISVTSLEGDPDVYVNQFKRTAVLTPTTPPTQIAPDAAGCGTLAEFMGTDGLYLGLSAYPASPARTGRGYYTYLKPAQSTFRKVSALRESALGAVSFQACHAAYESHFLRRIGSRLKLAPNDGSDGFAGDASWYVRPDVFGEAGAEGYECVSKPDYFFRRGTWSFTKKYIFVGRVGSDSLKASAKWSFALANPAATTRAPTFPPTMPMPGPGSAGAPASSDWPARDPNHAQYYAWEVGSDVVVVTSSSAHACAPDAASGAVCELLVSVYSYTASKYTVLLSFSSSWRYATNLIDGVPQVSVLLCTVTFYANLAHSLTRSP